MMLVAVLTGLFLLCIGSTTALPTAPSLAETGDLGKIVDSQGIVSVRPKMGTRWSGASKDFPVKPGDWLRTDVRGANAMSFRLRGGGQVILGPGTLVEVIDAKTIAFTRGEIEISAAKKGEITVRPVEGKGFHLRGGERKVLRRADGRGVQLLDKDPNWLLGFKGAVTSESMGSLLAKVDGRNTPLTLGFHKVSADIRDGIARTVIEESFVNHTGSRLEGTFYFPLPQDASISGFGMWIGGELVEADVVEKQRAREIYETILRERRDPGLLEWTGGNLFKARVFPIEAHSEKRIKITYTQVLPMRHGKLRYRYGLQSEMLQQNPLRELSINVRVTSALPIRAFTCATHDARISSTAHAAQAEFSAQEYTPDRDFEVEIDVNAAAAPVVMIPHQRGEDGYFLALLTPPGSAGNWQREIVPEGDPIHLVILADTSGSMHATARANQDALIAGLLGSLGENDSFDLATCDTEVHWFNVEKFAGTRDDYAELARGFVANRNSLGWTDLDRVFLEALKVTEAPNTHVVYIGDGVLTTGDADPVAFANRLKRRYAEQKSHATFHAIAPGSSYESGVLKAIASLGGGSLRKISGSDTSATVARNLLTGIARPGMRDLRIEFKGLRTARVYPAELPNLPVGSQQVVLGRYLPGEAEQSGEIIVTGTRDGRDVRFSTSVTLAETDQGNSFIPRLWARMHLDALLEQGRTREIKNQIIALSEEYKIMTPYTSFLVLESDADRERFKVKKRFEMRDGERFFADGRERANDELLQKQMRLAGSWRLNLRRGVLRDLAGLGREPIVPVAPGFGGGHRYARVQEEVRYSIDLGGASSPRRSQSFSSLGKDFHGAVRNESSQFDIIREFNYPTEYDYSEIPLIDADSVSDGRKKAKILFDDEFSDQSKFDLKLNGRFDRLSRKPGAKREMPMSLMTFASGFANQSEFRSNREAFGSGWYWPHYMGDLLSLFPGPMTDGRKLPDRETREHPWPAEALALTDSLLRLEPIGALRDGGIGISQQTRTFEPRRGTLVSEASVDALLSAKSWCVTAKGDRQGGDVQWWRDGKTRGHYFDALGFGRQQTAKRQRDQFAFPIELSDHSLASLADGMRGMDVRIEKREGERVELILTNSNNPKLISRYLIDTTRHVLLKVTHMNDGKVTGTSKFSDFVELAGCWWARLVEHQNANGKTYSRIKRSLRAHTIKQFRRAMKMALRPRDKVVFIHQDLPTVNEAKQATADGKTSFETAFVLCNHFTLSQQWDRSSEHFEEMRKHAQNKRGMLYLEIRFQMMKRRNEEALTLTFETARELATTAREYELFLATHLNSEVLRLSQANERLDFLEIVKPIYLRAAEHLLAYKGWRLQMVSALQVLNHRPEAHKLLRQLAGEFPRDSNLQVQFANDLTQQGETDAALAWLDDLIAKDDEWQAVELNTLRRAYVNTLENQNRVKEVLTTVTKWLKQDGIDDPHSSWVRRRYLSALIRTGKDEEAYELIETWIRDAVRLKGDAFDTTARNRAAAAVETLCGSAYKVNRPDIPERFHRPLAGLIRRYALDSENARYAELLMQSHQKFTRTEAARRLRAHFAKLLAKRAGKLEVAVIYRIYNWIAINDPAVDKEVWADIAETLIERWSRLEKRSERNAIASAIIPLISTQLDANTYLGFLRRQLNEAQDEHRAQYANQLFTAILAQPHQAELEDEAFALLDQMGASTPDPSSKQHRDAVIAQQAGALIRLDDWILKSGFQVSWDQLEDKEKLSRTELAAKRKELIKAIREKLSARLHSEMELGRVRELAEWLRIERLFVDIPLGRDPASLAAECWQFLEARDLHAALKKDKLPWLEHVLIERYVTTLEFLATRPKADPALATRLLKWLDQGIASVADTEPWKLHKYQLLVALDRPQALKETLASWITAEDANNNWRVTLGYLHAELDEIPAAIEIFEAVKKADELGPLEYKTLADWYLVADRKSDRDRAILGYYQAMEEWQISQLIQKHTSRIEKGFNNGTPEEFDPAVVDMFKATFKKTPHPYSHLHHLSNLFRYTKDFRLLECIPEGILGNSAQQIYPFLQQMDTVLRYVGDEATTDQILAHLAAVRGRATTPTDQRGLDLLEMLVRRKASEVLNQPGQHVPLALAAMQRAFKRDWGSGERRLMAGFLAGLGRITQEPLAAEQLRELEALFRAEENATPDQLHIAMRWAETVRTHGGPGAQHKSLDILESALDAFIAAHGEALTTDAQNAFNQLISWFEADQLFARGEKKIFAALERDINTAVLDWLVERKFRLYTQAIAAKTARVSLGEGEELYRNVVRDLTAALTTKRNNHRYELCRQLIEVYRSARFQAKIEQSKQDIVTFAEGAFAEMIGFETQNYQSLVRQLGNAIQSISGDLPALAFLVGRMEIEPGFFRAAGRGGWQGYGSSIAEYRTRVKDLGDLEPRLLKIVLTELRNDLETQSSMQTAIYHSNSSSYFWSEKRNHFQALAEKVARERKKSIVPLRYIANYLFHGLDAHQPAIDILIDAHRRGIRDEDAISMLATFLAVRKRHAETLPYLREIVAMSPERADYRNPLITQLGLAGQRDAAIAALDQAIAHFKEHKLWNEDVIRPLADACYGASLWKQGVTLYNELIPLHQRTQPNRGIGNSSLSHYYDNLSACQAQLGNTTEAVDAAAGAIISWGPSHSNRSSATEALRQVLAEAENLPGYVDEFEQSVTESGLENPIVRKALGQVLADRKQYQNALHHLRLAAESQPGDLETQQALLKVYDALDDPEGAIKQLLESVALSPLNIVLLKDLADRYQKLGREAEAERARTNLIEALPNESEGHAMLAEIREAQDHWDAAARQWTMVAEIRALEPTGLQRLAKAQLKLGKYDAAKSTLKTLLAKEWPSRFGDVHGTARNTLATVEKAEREHKETPDTQSEH